MKFPLFNSRSLRFLLMSTLAISTGAALLFLFLNARSYDRQVEDDAIYNETLRNHYQIYAPSLPEELSFLDADVPMDNYLVRESLDKELLTNMYLHGTTIQILKRSTRYFPIIEPILKSYGLPDDLKYLCVAESSLNQAVSGAGAVGFWQFMKSTAVEYGLEVNDEIDERYHIEKSTHAACQYLKDRYAGLNNDWILTCAAYNLGENGLRKRMDNQKIYSYWDLQLPTETSRYVFRIIALKLILEQPENYGFRLRDKDYYPPLLTREITIDSSISNIYDFARSLNVPYKVLRSYNPWFRGEKLTNTTHKTYTFQLPGTNGLSWKHLKEHQEHSHR